MLPSNVAALQVVVAVSSKLPDRLPIGLDWPPGEPSVPRAVMGEKRMTSLVDWYQIVK